MEINAAEFKAKCLKLLDQVAATHEPLVITKRGKPVARLVPVETEPRTSLFGYMKGTAQILGTSSMYPMSPGRPRPGKRMSSTWGAYQ